MTIVPRNSPPVRVALEAAPLRKQVLKLLRDSILAFDYQQGDRLIERELCERFGVSRVVIREVLRELEAEGLVETLTNRGPVVCTLRPGAVHQLYQVRSALEPLAASLCAENATPAEISRLRRKLKGVHTAYSEDDVLQQLRAKEQFYRAMTSGAHNEVLTGMLHNIQARVQLLRGVSLREYSRRQESLAELMAIVEAIATRDPKKAAECAALHVENAGRAVIENLAEDEEAAMAQTAKAQK